MSEYRFHLQKYKLGNRYACPQCGRKRCFARYIDEEGPDVYKRQVVTMNRVVATIILRLIISRTIPMLTAMMIGDIKHQSKSAGKRNLFQLSLRIS